MSLILYDFVANPFLAWFHWSSQVFLLLLHKQCEDSIIFLLPYIRTATALPIQNSRLSGQ